jgi:glycosyltransferase involved in cell wall biosynthesis
MIYDIVLNELKEFLPLLLFIVIFISWTYVFAVYFKSRSHTPRIDSNQFYTTIKNTDESSLRRKKETRLHSACDSLPFVSIIVPVRNEEKYIRRCLLSLLVQDYPNFEVIVIDDNSTDSTLKTIEEFKKGRGTAQHQEEEKRMQLVTEEEEKIKVLSLTGKPEGWAGKTWASEQGYLQSKGNILLFTDGDTHYHRKDVVSLALSYMHGLNLDVLTGIPSTGKIHDFWSRTILPLWGLVNVLFGVNNTADVNNPKSKYAYLMGSFFVIKRKVFKDIGTFQSVRGALQEDKALGFHVKGQGYNMKIVRLNGMVSVVGSKGNVSALWHLIGRTLAPLVVKNGTRVIANLLTILLVAFLPFIILPFTFFSVIEMELSFPSSALSFLQLFLSQPEFNYHNRYLILYLNIICCLIVIIAVAIKGIQEHQLPPFYSLLTVFAAFFLTVACIYNILPLLLFNKTRPIIWQGRKYIYSKEQEGFSI